MSEWIYIDDGLFHKNGVDFHAEIIAEKLNAAESRIAELEAQVEELKLENERLQDAWLVDETIMPDGSLRPPVSKLIARIDELKDHNKVLEDVCEILRKENSRLFQQVWADGGEE